MCQTYLIREVATAPAEIRFISFNSLTVKIIGYEPWPPRLLSLRFLIWICKFWPTQHSESIFTKGDLLALCLSLFKPSYPSTASPKLAFHLSFAPELSITIALYNSPGRNGRSFNLVGESLGQILWAQSALSGELRKITEGYFCHALPSSLS